MVYMYEVPYVHTHKMVDVTMIYDAVENRFIEAEEYNKDNNIVKFNLDYGEHLVFHLRCDDGQCNLNIDAVGVYEEGEQVKLVNIGGYSTTLGRLSVSIIPSVKYAPPILRYFLAYLRPFDLPCEEFPLIACIEKVLDEIAKFFNEYYRDDDD